VADEVIHGKNRLIGAGRLAPMVNCRITDLNEALEPYRNAAAFYACQGGIQDRRMARRN
jgi:hypothetical protein